MSKELLLFIHGLGGNPLDTWRGFPELVQADKALRSRFEVGFFHYPTSLFRFPFSQKLPRIQTLAGALRTQINNAFTDYDDITLVCHSLGGLIGRKYIIEEVQREEGLRVKRMLLFAVPNNGAGLASVAKYVSLWHGQLKQLCMNSDLIEFLNEEWFKHEMSHKIAVKYVVAAQDKVVDEKSAKLFWGNPNVEVLANRGHVDCVKPSGPKDLAFLILKNFILTPKPRDASRGFSIVDVPWKNLQPLMIEPFTAYEDNEQTRERILGGNLVYGQENYWYGELADGTYRLSNTQGMNAAKYFHLQISDSTTSEKIDHSESIVSVEVKHDFTENSTAFSGAGLIYRFSRQSKYYYAFLLQKDQTFMFYKRNAHAFQELYSGHYTSNRADGFNKIAIIGKGASFHLYLNDVWIKTIEDAELMSGEVGIIAMGIGVFSFDNFAIYKVPAFG